MVSQSSLSKTQANKTVGPIRAYISQTLFQMWNKKIMEKESFLPRGWNQVPWGTMDKDTTSRHRDYSQGGHSQNVSTWGFFLCVVNLPFSHSWIRLVSAISCPWPMLLWRMHRTQIICLFSPCIMVPREIPSRLMGHWGEETIVNPWSSRISNLTHSWPGYLCLPQEEISNLYIKKVNRIFGTQHGWLVVIKVVYKYPDPSLLKNRWQNCHFRST